MHTATALPLQRYELFHSRDVDEARESVARIFCPHRLCTTQPRTHLDARHHSARLHHDVSLNYVQYGPSVDIEPGHLKDFYLLQIPLRGGAEVRCGGQQVRADVQTASLPSPTEPLTMRWADDSPHLIVKFSRSALQCHLERLAQQALGRPLVFELGVRLDDPSFAPALNFIACLRDTLDTGNTLTDTPMAEQGEAYLLSSLLMCLRHNHSAALNEGARRGLLPRTVRRAQEFLESRTECPVSLADVCQHVGVSARALQLAFKEHTGLSPMEFLRLLRLDRVHQALQAAGAAGAPPIGQVAARYGFIHLGHFAAQYHARFGELPTQTLKRARRH